MYKLAVGVADIATAAATAILIVVVVVMTCTTWYAAVSPAPHTGDIPHALDMGGGRRDATIERGPANKSMGGGTTPITTTAGLVQLPLQPGHHMS